MSAPGGDLSGSAGSGGPPSSRGRSRPGGDRAVPNRRAAPTGRSRTAGRCRSSGCRGPRPLEGRPRLVLADRREEAADGSAAEAQPGHAQAGPAERHALGGFERHGRSLRIHESASVDVVRNDSVSSSQSSIGQHTERSRSPSCASSASARARVRRSRSSRGIAGSRPPRSSPTVPRRWPRCSPVARRQWPRCGRPRTRLGSRNGSTGRRPRAPGPVPSSRQGRGHRTELSRACRRGGYATGPPRRSYSRNGRPPSSATGAEIRWDPGLTEPGRLGGRAGRRHRAAGPRRVRGGGPRLRPRLHLPERRVGPGHPVRRRPVGPRQVARHVLPDGPGPHHRR